MTSGTAAAAAKHHGGKFTLGLNTALRLAEPLDGSLRTRGGVEEGGRGVGEGVNESGAGVLGSGGVVRDADSYVVGSGWGTDHPVSRVESGQGFEPALAGRDVWLVNAAGQLLIRSVGRWHDCADETDEWLLQRCGAATVDVGCGPGRLVAELGRRGVPALGVDVSARAVRLCRERGGHAMRADAWAVLPGEGGWRHVVLADGNIGIGGDPAALLRRCVGLLRPGGTVLVETTPADQIPADAARGLWRGEARLCERGTGRAVGVWFPWAVVELDALIGLARGAGWRLVDVHRGHRCFVQLRRPGAVE